MIRNTILISISVLLASSAVLSSVTVAPVAADQSNSLHVRSTPKLRGVVSHMDVASFLFPSSAKGEHDHDVRRSLLLHNHQQRRQAISLETLSITENPSMPSQLQKKVQQTHLGLPVFGHSFVLGIASDGVTEIAEGSYGTVVSDELTASEAIYLLHTCMHVVIHHRVRE